MVTFSPVLFTPNTFQPGSSILHLNQSFEGTPNRLMIPTQKDPQHHPGPITMGILKDIGWNTITLPLATLEKSASANSVSGGAAFNLYACSHQYRTPADDRYRHNGYYTCQYHLRYRFIERRWGIILRHNAGQHHHLDHQRDPIDVQYAVAHLCRYHKP